MNNQQKDKVAKILKEAQEAPDDEIVEEPKEEDEPEPKEEPGDQPSEPADEPKDEPKEKATEESKDQPKPQEPKQSLPKPEDRLVESQKESYILAQKNKKLNDAIEQAANLPEPSEDELKRKYPEWDTLPEYAKKLAKDNYINERRFALIDEQRIEGRKIDEWAGKVDAFLAADAGKTIPDGQEDRFRSFCMKPTRRGLDFDDLKAAFLYTAEVSTPRTQHKGSLFTNASGGNGANSSSDKPKELTAEEIQAIRQSDPKRYKKLVKAGKVNLV